EIHRLIDEATGIGSAGERVERKRSLSFAGFRNGQARNQLECSFGGDAFETRELSRLGEPTVLVAVHRDPHVERIVQTLRATPEVYSPQLSFTGDIAQGLERDRDLDRVAVACHHSLRIHDEIETEVF